MPGCAVGGRPFIFSIGAIHLKPPHKAFVNKTKGVRLVVWGDDITFLGHGKDLKEAADMLKQWCDIKVRAVEGPGAR